jgi:hypothetical protein
MLPLSEPLTLLLGQGCRCLQTKVALAAGRVLLYVV